MPIFLPESDIDLAGKQSLGSKAPTTDDHSFASAYTAGLDRSLLSSTSAMALGSVLDLGDTVASSVIPGISRGDVNNRFLSSIGGPGLTKWYDENKSSMEVGSALTGTVISTWAAGKIIKPGGKMLEFMRSIPGVRTIATLDRQYENAVRVAKIATRESALRGAMGVDRFIGTEMNIARLGMPAFSISQGQAATGVYRAGLVRGFAHNVTTEAIMATALHTNSMLYSDDLGHNLAWAGAGLVLGAGIDNLVSTYALRKIANSDQIRQLNRKAFDPTGLETQRIAAYGVVDQILRDSGADPIATGWMFGSGGGVTDRVTSLAIQASELSRAPKSLSERALALGKRREQLATPTYETAFQEMQKVTVRGIRGVSGSGFSTRLEGLGKPINQSIEREATSMHGIEEIGTTPENMTRLEVHEMRKEKLQARWNQIQELLSNGGKWKKSTVTIQGQKVPKTELIPLKEEERAALMAEALELNATRQHVPMTMLEPGEWAPLSYGEIAEGFQPRRVITEGSLGEGDAAVWYAEHKSQVEPRIGISSNGELFLPEAAKGRVESLNDTEALQLFHVANNAIRHFQKTGQTFVVPKNASWFVLDMAEQIIKATDNPNSVKFWRGMTRDEAAIEAFAQKVDVIKRKQLARKLASNRGFNLDDISDADAFAMKVRLNLPRLTTYQQGMMNMGEAPLDVLLHGFESGAQVRGMSYQELNKAFNDARVIKDFTEETAPGIKSLQGNSFNFLMDAEGNPIKPIIGYKRAMRPMEFTRDSLFTRQALREADLRNHLVGADADAYTKLLTDTLAADPAFAQARKVMELADDQRRSFIPGFRSAASQSTRGAFIGAVTTRERRDVDNMVMRAASQVKELQTRITQRVGRAMFEKNMGNLITEIKSTRNAKSKMLLDQFHSFRPGWEIAAKETQVTLPDGTKGFSFILDHESVGNQKRFEQAYGRPLEKGQTLLNPSGQAIVLDELSMRTLLGMQGVHKETIAAKNTLLRSQGLPEIKEVPWYTPPPPMKGMYVGWVFDSQDNIVPGMSIRAHTPEEYQKLVEEMRKSPQWKDMYSIRSRDDVEAYMSLWDKAQMDFVAPNTTAIQPKKVNRGFTGTNQINMSAFEEALGVMMDSIVRHGDDVIDVLYDPVIKAAKSRGSIARVETGVGSRQAVQHSSIYDQFVQNLTGRTSLSAKDSFWGDPYRWLEQRMNGFLSEGGSRFRESNAGQVYSMFRDYIRGAAGIDGKTLTGRQFEEFSKQLGNYMPFKSAAEMLQRQTATQIPSEVADITSKLSWFEASSRLRWFESMHAMANFGSMVANMPSVVRALQPMKGESAAEAAARNGSLTMLMSLPNGGGDIVLPHSTKLLWSSMRDAQKGIRDEFTEKAIRLGFMDQEVAEFQRAWAAIDSKAGWRKFMFGDPNAKSRVGKLGIDGVLGLMSDKSEAFTRQWGMYAGRRVAEAMGIRNVDAQLNFAHELTNKLIANYDPRNRAEIFQGALGAPLGLFQSYTVNFYQRMFRYIETGNTRALATQYATQGAIFGGESLPGWDAVNWAFFDHGQGESNKGKDQDPIESMYARLGTEAGDLYMHGLLSNLPKIFGADGMALYTRGDSQFRLPVSPLNIIKGDAIVSIPMTDTFKRVYQGISQAVATLNATGKIGLNHLAEIASNVITNRPLAGLIEVAGAGGYDTDSAGQLVARSVFPSMEAMYRILGTRSMAQQKEIENFYASRNAQEEQSGRKDILNIATRAAIRDGRYNEIQGLFNQYVEEGGDQRYYSAWLKRSFEAASHTRGERQLEKALKDPNDQSNAYVVRLLDGDVDVNEAEQDDEDYGREAAMQQLIEQGWQTTPTAEVDDNGDSMMPLPEQ